MLEIKRLGKVYGEGAKATHAIAEISFEVADADHRLGFEQHAGIGLERARELAEPYQQA